MTTEQPYFTVKVTRCWECPYAKHAMCGLEAFEKYGRFLENCNGITPTCPNWSQGVEPPKD